MFKYIRNLKNNPQFHIVFFFSFKCQTGNYLSALVIRYIQYVLFDLLLKQKICANISVSATTMLCLRVFEKTIT